MTPEAQEKFILQMYEDLFRNTDVQAIAKYCAPNFIKENNYDVSNYTAFVKHIEDLKTQEGTPIFHIEFIVNISKQVVIRTVVDMEDKIKGAPPVSLLMSYWQFNDDGLIDYCKEVEHSE